MYVEFDKSILKENKMVVIKLMNDNIDEKCIINCIWRFMKVIKINEMILKDDY